jgi:glycosyltransferase involved in cell wall biosynthesis
MDHIKLVVSVDTEEDNWQPTRSGLSVENLREVPQLVEFLERLDLRATFFTTYQVASRPWAAGILRYAVASGRAEIGAHLHPWNTPPLDAPEPAQYTMLNNYAMDVQRVKLGHLTKTITKAFGSAPLAFRAGRFGFNQSMARVLIEHGYRVDSSVTPFITWEGFDGGPNFIGAPLDVYRLDGSTDVREPLATGPLVEVPLSVGYTRFSSRRWNAVARVFRARSAQLARLPGLAARTGIVMRAILSPETNSVREMLAVSRGLIEGGARHLHLFFHSSSLRPGLSPFTSSRTDVRRFYDTIERFVDRVRTFAPMSPATVTEAAGVTPPPQSAGMSRKPGASVPAPRRLVVVTYHYPPDGSVGGLRWAGFAKYLVRLGWEVHILTASQRAPAPLAEGVMLHLVAKRRTLNDWYLAISRRLRRPRHTPDDPAEQPRITRHFRLLRALQRELGALTSFPDESRGWILRAALAAQRLIQRFEPTVVVSSGPPHGAHLAARLATARTHQPWVMDLRDPWVGQSRGFANNPVYGTPMMRRLVGVLERACVRAAAGAICNTPELTSRWKERYPDVRLTWIPNGVDLERLPRPTDQRLPGLSIVYAGTLYGSRDLRPVAQAFAQFLAQHPEAASDGSKLRVAGVMEAPHARKFEQRIAELGIEKHVEFLGMLPEADALQLVAKSRLSIVLAQEQEVQVPAKLYEAMGLGVTPLVLTEPGSATATEARRIGAPVVASDNVDEMTSTLARVWRQGGLARIGTVPTPIDYHHLSGTVSDFLINESAVRYAAPREQVLDPRANWLWLMEIPHWEAALEVVASQATLHRGLAARFRTVTTLTRSDFGRTTQRLPAADQSFDLIAIHGAWALLTDRSSSGMSAARVIAECRRILKPGGCLYIGDDNPDWFRRLSHWPGSYRGNIRRLPYLLRSAGFHMVRTYYADPSFDDPTRIVPTTRAAMVAHERFATSLTAPLRSWLRRVLVLAGLHRMLEPSLLVLASK